MKPHYRFIFRGHIDHQGTYEEQWSFGLKLIPAGLGQLISPVPDAYAQAAAVACGLFLGREESRIAAAVDLREVRANTIAANGKVTPGELTTVYDPVTNYNGGNALSPRYPNQISVCVTLANDSNRRGSRGRFYLPPPQGFSMEGSTIPDTIRDAIRGSVVDFLTDMRDIDLNAPEGHKVIVPSDSPNNPEGYFEVSRVGVGRVFDTVRSRRRDLPEDQEFVPFLQES